MNISPKITTLGGSTATMLSTPGHKSSLKSKLMKQYAKWEGTPYQLGGHQRRGIDCSALMQEIFRGTKTIRLPRTTREQKQEGRHVRKRALRPGDLVFFKTSARTRHVGVYIGNDEFIHASQKVGVTISSLNNQYWETRYETARRVTDGV
ncbi:NlpC/P60 family protein [Trabulsiella odontotermitis]|uniref:NlpC/P60 family protein n=1 Tax=Trabulsiella odontotermitis TaxID=379893 RepID=UPI0024B76443|nr:NlpC/P60 family protein [Trabulsiella odontotermitis]WHP33287.1 NlpC/P60 family protein [Trabulsiella odontotermitis]